MTKLSAVAKLGVAAGVLAGAAVAHADGGPGKSDSGDTAWLLTSTALVMLMPPGLALFCGGMVRTRNVLATFMYSFAALAVVTVQWVVVGYSLAFGADHGGVVGGFEHVLLRGVGLGPRGTVPALLFMADQLMCAVITPALISGAVAERVKFSAWVLFTVLWATLVYDPVAHWVWAEGGWLNRLGVLDFAGGTDVHLVAGVSALVFALVLGPRLGHPRRRSVPHNLTLTVVGAGVLWFGWLGFNGGSALTSGGVAVLALVNTHLAAAGAAGAWAAAEWLRVGKASMLGLVSGLVAGLVAITPAAGFVSPGGALVIGLLAGVVCYGAVLAKERLGYDDSLDAFGIHGVGGLLGALLTGVLAAKVLQPRRRGRPPARQPGAPRQASAGRRGLRPLRRRGDVWHPQARRPVGGPARGGGRGAGGARRGAPRRARLRTGDGGLRAHRLVARGRRRGGGGLPRRRAGTRAPGNGPEPG